MPNNWHVLSCTYSYHVFDGMGAEFWGLTKYYADKLCKYCNENNVDGKTCDMDKVMRNAKVKMMEKVKE